MARFTPLPFLDMPPSLLLLPPPLLHVRFGDGRESLRANDWMESFISLEWEIERFGEVDEMRRKKEAKEEGDKKGGEGGGE
ncbi:Os01g0949260 [Oryza sativa Japonica Group]|uniref:Os01g0949260 protein n=1 Tax=Oryza sativa subsp. japonica TaxID=39947 RepID=A0A0P0VD00_ORYSJ|nr:hypothetical protein EE612_007978 [Oryza sativa]BAS76223.1 Os01g0949260 [Oryza sativa Japonica Group]